MLDRDLITEEIAHSVFRAEHICNRNPLQLSGSGLAAHAKLMLSLFELEQAPIEGSNGLQIVRASDLEHSDLEGATAALAVSTPSANWIEHSESLHQALGRLGKKGWLFVRANDSLLGTISHQDLGRSAVSAYLLALILCVERGLRRLYGSYEGRPIPDEPVGSGVAGVDPEGKPDTFYTTIKAVRGCQSLIEDLGFTGAKNAKKTLFKIKELRDHLAHARSVMECGESLSAVMQRISELESLFECVNKLIRDRKAVWDAYSATEIIGADDPSMVLVGSASTDLPAKPPLHIISAQNPYEQYLGDDENERRTRILGDYLSLIKEVTYLGKVVGRSSDPEANWKEESWAVSGISRSQALEIGRLFQQRAIFELTNDDATVLSSNGMTVSITPRHRPS